jgi:hypothetical protein
MQFVSQQYCLVLAGKEWMVFGKTCNMPSVRCIQNLLHFSCDLGSFLRVSSGELVVICTFQPKMKLMRVMVAYGVVVSRSYRRSASLFEALSQSNPYIGLFAV